MSFAFFIYTILVMGVGLVTASTALVIWLMTRRRDCLVAAAGFLLYIFDMSVIFFDEYNRLKYDYMVTFNEPLQHPLLRCALGVAILACVWLWVTFRLHDEVTVKHVAAYVVPIAVLQLTLVPRTGFAGQVQQYLFWLVRDLGMAFCLVYAYARYRKTENRAERLDLERSRTFFRIACVLTVMVVIEDTYMILFCTPDVDNVMVSAFLWYLSERNISENLLFVAAAVQLFKQFSHILRVFSRHPRADEEVATERRDAREDLVSRVVIFSDEHGLSKREQEVLTLVLRGLDVQNIANELVISPGTVKAHLHRIYVKSEVKARDDLIETFWRS